MKRIVVLVALLSSGCFDDVDRIWELDHDRIIAVRATPPRIQSGEQATLDALIGKKGASPSEEVPAVAMVVSPESLASTLSFTGGAWVVTAPEEEQLAAARTELGLEADAPVPLVVGVAFPASVFPSGEIAEGLAATKTVWLGDTAENPVLAPAEVNGVDATMMPEIVVPKGVDVRLRVPFEVTEVDVNWLTSCGTMYDYDLPAAYLRVEDDDSHEGDLAVVVRTDEGGVAWHVWPIRAE